jgi:hypothetical protein
LQTVLTDNMAKKKVFIPFPVHLVKFIKHEMDWDDEGNLILTGKRLLRPARISAKEARHYFKNMAKNDQMQLVPALTVDSRLYKIYAFTKYVDSLFQEKMMNYVLIRALAPIYADIRPTIREYLALYEIYESEYSQNTAYKRWQRSKQYIHLKNIYERNNKRFDQELRRDP